MRPEDSAVNTSEFRALRKNIHWGDVHTQLLLRLPKFTEQQGIGARLICTSISAIQHTGAFIRRLDLWNAFTMTSDITQKANSVKSPKAFVHVVLKTNKYKETIDFYCKLLGAHIAYSNDVIAFLAYDEEHHRIGIVYVESLKERDPGGCGLDHLAFSLDSLDDLAAVYHNRKGLGILPAWCVNHGPATSMYYRDPDGNKVEMQVDNFDTVEEANEFMMGEEFRHNPIGVDFDPEDLVRRLQSGEDHQSIKKRPQSGPRAVPIHLTT